MNEDLMRLYPIALREEEVDLLVAILDAAGDAESGIWHGFTLRERRVARRAAKVLRLAARYVRNSEG